jgi:CheY-like chemotaxis protein
MSLVEEKMDIAHLHFLVAEADPSQRAVLGEMLGQLGASQVTEVPDGHTAFAVSGLVAPTVNVAIIGLCCGHGRMG